MFILLLLLVLVLRMLMMMMMMMIMMMMTPHQVSLVDRLQRDLLVLNHQCDISYSAVIPAHRSATIRGMWTLAFSANFSDLLRLEGHGVAVTLLPGKGPSLRVRHFFDPSREVIFKGLCHSYLILRSA